MSDRNSKGQFKKGNRGGPGNPLSRQVNRLRTAMLSQVKEGNIKTVLKQLIEKAEGGDLAAAKILFDRVFGPPLPVDIIQRLEDLERTITGDEKQ